MNNTLSSQGEIVENVLLEKKHPLVKFAINTCNEYKKWHGQKRFSKAGWKIREIPIEPKKDIEEYKNIVNCIISELVARGIAQEKDFNTKKWLPELLIEINIVNTITCKKLNSGLAIHNDGMRDNNDTYSINIYLENNAVGGEFGIYKPYKFLELISGDYIGAYDILRTKDIKKGFVQAIMYNNKNFHKPAPVIAGSMIYMSFVLNRDIHIIL